MQKCGGLWGLGLVWAATACGNAGADGSLGKQSSAIVAEQPNGIAEIEARHYGDASLARTAAAIADIAGCTGVLIGPSLLLTAGHCGDADATATFYSNPGRTAADVGRDSYACQILINTYPHTDIALYYCAGAPGTTYGYADLDATAPAFLQNVYSHWVSTVDSLGLPRVPLYSAGIVTATNIAIDGPPSDPQFTDPMHERIGIRTSLWSDGGDGSPVFDTASHRLFIGPTSAGEPDDAGRSALSLKTDLELGSVDGWTDTDGIHHSGVHEGTLRAIGLDPSKYAGAVDKNRDYLFDIQTDLERIIGEPRRSQYDLAFDSERRNALWDVNSPNADLLQRVGRPVVSVNVESSTAPLDLLVHRHLNLPAGRYRFGLTISTYSTSQPSSLRVALRQNGVNVASYDVATPWTPTQQRRTFELVAPTDGLELALIGTGALQAEISELAIVDENDPYFRYSFGDFAKTWQDSITGEPANILTGCALNLDSGCSPKLAITGDPNAGFTTATSVINRSFPFVAGKRYRLCLAFLQMQPEATNPTDLEVRITDNGVLASQGAFAGSASDWWGGCIAPMVATTAEIELQVGVASTGPGTGGYWLDNLDVITCESPVSDGVTCGTFYDNCSEPYTLPCKPGNSCVSGTCEPDLCKPLRCAKGYHWEPADCQCERLYN